MVQNTYQVTWKKFREWGFENAFKGARLGITIMWFFVAVFMVFMGKEISIAYFLLAFCLYRAFFRWLVITHTQYKQLCVNHKGADWQRTIRFEEKRIIVDDGILTVQYLFSDIEDIKEKENKIWLIMNNKTVVRLYKDCFTQGNWELCKEMINE